MVVYGTDSILTRTTRTNSTIIAPTGIVDGDTLVIVYEIGIAGAVPTPVQPAGFVLPVSGTYPTVMTDGAFTNHTYVWSKEANGEAGDYTILNASAITGAFMFKVSGAIPGPITVSTTLEGAGNPATAPGLNVPTDGSMVVWWANYWDLGDVPGPGGTTPTFTSRYNPLVASSMHVATGVFSGTGPTGDKTTVPPGSPWASGLLLIEAPAAAGGGTGSSRIIKIHNGGIK